MAHRLVRPDIRVAADGSHEVGAGQEGISGRQNGVLAGGQVAVSLKVDAIPGVEAKTNVGRGVDGRELGAKFGHDRELPGREAVGEHVLRAGHTGHELVAEQIAAAAQVEQRAVVHDQVRGVEADALRRRTELGVDRRLASRQLIGPIRADL